MLPKNRTAAVIGAGAMGGGIAQVLVMAGFQTVMVDVQQAFLDRGLASIERGLDFRVARGKMTAAQKAELLGRYLSTSLDLRRAVAEAQVVIEAVPEIMELKKEVLAAVSEAAPKEALLASNTSTMSITEIAAVVSEPGRVAGMHFFNPVPAMRLVEVVRGRRTTDETMEQACQLAAALGKIPVEVLKDSPGFIVNRIGAPNQALLSAILDEGRLRPDAVDTVMRRTGMVIAPFELIDFVGVDVYVQVMKYYARTLSPDFAPGRTLTAMVERGDLGMKTGRGIYTWRDGKAQIDLSQPSSEITPLDFLAIQINEAVRVCKEGIARSVADIDRAMVHGMRTVAGPFALTAGMDHQQIADTLNRLYKRYGLSIYLPEPEIGDGSFQKWAREKNGNR